MSVKKLTLSVDEKAIEKARLYSKRHHTSISRLVSGFLTGLPDAAPETTPRVRRLLGILPVDVDDKDYRNYLEDKYAP
ncbi:MAG: hypothetical protein GKR89_19305 [Candidatus Latescibacteria bacterium]|nr:hypothetical protein [Candidatus Latescibacterota bacterium]